MNRIKQLIRILDVFYIGIFLIFVASKYKLPSGIKIQLIVVGIGIILYNGFNFYIELQKEKLINKNKNREIHLSDLTMKEDILRKTLNENYKLKLIY